MIFIAHGLSVVRHFSDDVGVMHLGQIVEIGPAEAVYSPPYHLSTEALLSAVPSPGPEADQKEIRLSGNVPSALNPPSDAVFTPGAPVARRCFPVEERSAWKKPLPGEPAGEATGSSVTFPSRP